MTHLGARVSEYVDGQLPVCLTERVTAHLAACPACREAVERERRVKRALLAMPEPAPAADFMASLVALGGPLGPVAPRAGHVPGSPRPPLVTFEADVRRQAAFSLTPAGGPQRSASRRRRGGALIGAATVMGAGVLSAGLLPFLNGSSSLVRAPVGNIAVTPGANPLVQQNLVRRIGGSRATSDPSAPSAVTPTSVPNQQPSPGRTATTVGSALVYGSPFGRSGFSRPVLVASFPAGGR